MDSHKPNFRNTELFVKAVHEEKSAAFLYMEEAVKGHPPHYTEKTYSLTFMMD